MSLADIIQIIIGVLSLVATIAVSFLIYWLQSRHEKEIQKLQCEKERIALQEKARLFLIDNQEERDYLPWCIIAANLYQLEKGSCLSCDFPFLIFCLSSGQYGALLVGVRNPIG